MRLFFLCVNSAYKAQKRLSLFTEAKHFGIIKHILVYLKLHFQRAHCLVYGKLNFQKYMIFKWFA